MALIKFHQLFLLKLKLCPVAFVLVDILLDVSGQKRIFLIENPVQDILVRNKQLRVEKVRVTFTPADVQAV